MKYKLNKFGLSLVVLFAVAFSSLSIADDMKKDTAMSDTVKSSVMSDAAKASAIAKIKAYYDMKSPEKWQTTGTVEYNQSLNIFRGLIQVMYKDSKKVQVYIVPLNLSLKGSTVEKVDKVEPEVEEEVKKVEGVK